MDRASDSKFNTVTFDDLTSGELLADIYNDSYAEIVKKDFRFHNFIAIEPYK